MGDFVVRHEPAMIDVLRQSIQLFEIFKELGWMEYFERLNGLHGEMALQFVQNVEGDHSEVVGLRIDVLEHVIAKVT